MNCIEVPAKVDFPCRVQLRMYLLLDFNKRDNSPKVHFWWLVVIMRLYRDILVVIP